MTSWSKSFVSFASSSTNVRSLLGSSLSKDETIVFKGLSYKEVASLPLALLFTS